MNKQVFRLVKCYLQSLNMLGLLLTWLLNQISVIKIVVY